MKTNLLLLIAICLTATACGKITASMDAVSSMNGKMDETNQSMKAMLGKMDITNSKMDITNEGMNKTVAGMDKTNAGMDRTNAGMDKSNEGIKKSNDGVDKTLDTIHKQTLGVALDTMLKPDYTKYVSLDSTVPTSMMPSGKTFAEVATQEEIALLVTANILEINTAQPDSSLMVEDPKVPGKKDFPASVKNADDTAKWVKFTATQIVAGFAPQATIEDMVKVQITNGGGLENAAYETLYMRHYFISTFILDNNILAQTLETPGMFEDALKYIAQLKYIEQLPFRDSINVQLTGFFDVGNRGLNKTWGLEKSDVKKDYYAKLKADLKQLSSRFKNPTTPEETARLASIKKQIDDGIAGK